MVLLSNTNLIFFVEDDSLHYILARQTLGHVLIKKCIHFYKTYCDHFQLLWFDIDYIIRLIILRDFQFGSVKKYLCFRS